ncbi:5-guanidino-2-oxopentanoate decarboxylase [Microbulbifer thermotolerans]|uniref:5-guanidino-2-oxopentanoate decarboxylase n=1 Tax=Microbulbifer thermotolerans TaxID=252514 RepID=UPI00224ADE81|nr:5-guanidino-2-oxopentanoate decarboxylase [Microbulbifer thermotolerans]MCX2778842.1 5-guanidino-2-oxopentanoate decarboxylase [Microbulbifer thermotolerans]MCX2804147.1 5-guanidino-2-oxopentanoate decarboxylase [Microbulbifer thermotolerans]
MPSAPTCAQVLMRLLREYRVEKVFGIPGVHTIELYRGLPGSGLQHITPRHEQGAAFMADGYARASGRPGVCFLITGPGLTNAATAMAQAYSDSVPVLVISAVNRREDLGLGGGRLHELPRQSDVSRGLCIWQHTLTHAEQLPEVIARAFLLLTSSRPGPVHIEIPIDLFPAPMPGQLDDYRACPGAQPAAASAKAVATAAGWLQEAKRPAILLGGGAQEAGLEAAAISEKLGAPVFLSLAAKGVVDERHPLCGGANLSFRCARERVESADVVLAVGTELAETDRNLVRENYAFRGKLIRVDRDPAQLTCNASPDLAICADARETLEQLNGALQPRSDAAREAAAAEVAQILRDCRAEWWPGSEARFPWVEALRAALPEDGVLVTDSTQLAYNTNHALPLYHPRSHITCTTGYGTLGFALPAAIGAKLASGREVLALIGDGGLMFTLGELAVAVEQRLSLPILVWNNAGYGEIRDFMDAAEVPREGVELRTPDFVALARAFGAEGCCIHRPDQLADAVAGARARNTPTLIEIAVA